MFMTTTRSKSKEKVNYQSEIMGFNDNTGKDNASTKKISDQLTN